MHFGVAYFGVVAARLDLVVASEEMGPGTEQQSGTHEDTRPGWELIRWELISSTFGMEGTRKGAVLHSQATIARFSATRTQRISEVIACGGAKTNSRYPGRAATAEAVEGGGEERLVVAAGLHAHIDNHAGRQAGMQAGRQVKGLFASF